MNIKREWQFSWLVTKTGFLYIVVARMPRFIILSEPRTGSTYLQSLLNVHYDVDCRQDFLSDEYGPRDDPVGDVNRQLSVLRKPVVGFKTFPQHLVYHQLSLIELIRRLDVKWVIVQWRESFLEMYVSLQIALRTNVWYNSEPSAQAEMVEVNGKELMKYFAETEQRWKHVVQGWPPDIVPIFVKYEDLCQNTTTEMHRVLRCMSLDPTDYVFEAECCRQNPSPISQKVSTWNQLSDNERNTSIDIPSIVNEAIFRQLNVSSEFVHLLPDREPPPPPTGWRYKVCEPYITNVSTENVQDAVDGSSVSSAGRWPTEMSRKLRDIFGTAVAQPCSNGFAAIVLALRAASVGPGDDVILPSFTMIAVPNAVWIVGARPVPVDNAPGDYNPSIREIEAAATYETKAVIVTHTYGVPTLEMESIAKLCLQRRWFLIEDISECAGVLTTTVSGSRRLLGTFGDFACASMYANKLLHGGDGGFVLAKDATHRYRLGSLVNHGFTRSYHFVHLEKAPNFKISGLAAALACGNLDSIDDIMKHRSALARTYRRCLQATPLVLMPPCGPDDTPWVFGVCCVDKAQRQSLRQLLAEHGAETRNYFFPVHAQPAYIDEITPTAASFPNADHLAKTGFYLPSYTALTVDDIEWICSIVVSYFTKQEHIMECPKSASLSNSIRVNKKTLQLETRKFNDDGRLVEIVRGFNHHTTVAVSLRLRAQRYLSYERWDKGQILLHDMRECIAECREDGFDVAEQVLQPFIDYIVSQQRHELAVEEPWTNIDLTSGDLSLCTNISTTSEPEVLQLLYWLVQKVQGIPYILELGSLFGSSTAVMAVAAKQRSSNARVFAVDSFAWKPWMNDFELGLKRKIDESFFDVFQNNTSFVSDMIQVVQCDIVSDKFQTDTFDGFAFDVVYVDFTRSIDEMETAWKCLKPRLKEGVSVVVLNSLTINTIPFVANHQEELIPIAKPQGTTAKAYRYVNPAKKVLDVQNSTFHRRLRFLQSPDWNHHQGRAFNVAIDTLRDQLHSPNAEVDFIPAVEEFLCDFRDEILRPWVGIIHGVPEDNQFYPPDMKRLCSKRYRSVMKLCRGLFTLTDVQAKYLQNHLNNGRRIPVCPICLPMLPVPTVHASDVIERWKQDKSVDLVFIGSFARDFSFFFQVKVPSDVRKVLLSGDEVSIEWAEKAPPDVFVLSRLSAKDYEKMLSRSIVILALKYNGAANTIILECIARNIPIAAPRIDSCIDYLGASYPLLYDQSCDDMSHILSTGKVQEAIDYMRDMDKSVFSIGRFCQTIQSSSVLLSLPPEIKNDALQHLVVKFDVTVCVCTYKRTNDLHNILDSLLYKQMFAGAVQVIVWNNNEAREKVVRQICEPYLKRNPSTRCLELISSTSNHYCIIRACMLHLMRSDLLLICDDDVIPKQSFVQFFVDEHQQHNEDVLAVRGHRFLSHQLNHADPRSEWITYEHVRFVDDDEPEQLIHFLHADTCLIPRQALQDFVSVAMPDTGFILVDDYWMSFVLSHYFNRNLRKLQCRKNEHFERTATSDEVGLALYTRPEVEDAKIRMYVHHMLNGWPKWASEQIAESTNEGQTELMAEKKKWWNGAPFIGYNVASDLTREDAADLLKLGAKVVRIGAVGCREDSDFEFSGFLEDPTAQIQELRETVTMLAELDIGVILTLHKRVLSVKLWKLIATEFSRQPNVIGYDIINEPHVGADTGLHFTDVCNIPETALAEYFNVMTTYLQQIRSVDKVTPIIIEPTFWAKPCALPLLSGFVDRIRVCDSNIIVSVHFYEPQPLVSNKLNQGRYTFPGYIPLYVICKHSEEEWWDEDRIGREMESLRQWEIEHHVKLFIGEFGIFRKTAGAADYIRAVAAASLSRNISCLIYSFRETTWDAMNYELGPQRTASILNTRLPWNDNPLIMALMDIAQISAPGHA